MRLLRFFIWIGLLGIVLLLWSGTGSPHFIWSYTYRDMGGGNRHYFSCTYVGWGFASVTQPARGGKCAWVRFFEPEAGQ